LADHHTITRARRAGTCLGRHAGLLILHGELDEGCWFPGAIRITVDTIKDAPHSLRVADNGAIFWHFVPADP
jgi:hypothetical protein